MPFTAAHPAAALPLKRVLGRHGVTSALVIGSVAPDLAYFLPLPVTREESHGLGALLWFCLPVGALTYLYLHTLLLPLVVALLPTRWRAWPALDRPAGLPSAAPVAVLVSLLVGALTHLAWDAFTHADAPMVQALPALRARLFSWGGYTVYGYKLTQHGSTLLGVTLLACWSLRHLRRTRSARDAHDARAAPADAPHPLAARHRALVLAALLLPPLVLGAIAGAHAAQDVEGPLATLQHFVGAAIFTGGKLLVATLVLTSLAWRLLGSGTRRHA